MCVSSSASTRSLHAQVFFCKYNDPIYVKMEKLEIMIKLAADKNIDQVLLEFKEYATEVDVDFVRKVGPITMHLYLYSLFINPPVWHIRREIRKRFVLTVPYVTNLVHHFWSKDRVPKWALANLCQCNVVPQQLRDVGMVSTGIQVCGAGGAGHRALCGELGERGRALHQRAAGAHPDQGQLRGAGGNHRDQGHLPPLP